MFGSLGLPELLIILLIVIIIFGANKLPQLGRGLGQGMKNFKDSIKDGTSNGMVIGTEQASLYHDGGQDILRISLPADDSKK